MADYRVLYQAPTARFLQPGTSMNVWLELVVPDSPDSHSRDMFQARMCDAC